MNLLLHAAIPCDHVKSTFGLKFGSLFDLHFPDQEPPRLQQVGLPALSRTQIAHSTRAVIEIAFAEVAVIVAFAASV